MPHFSIRAVRDSAPEWLPVVFCLLAAVCVPTAAAGLELALGVWGCALAELAAPAACVGYLALCKRRRAVSPCDMSPRRTNFVSALYFAAVCLLFYYVGVLSGNLFGNFDMFTIGGTRAYIGCSLPVALLVFAVVPAVCEELLLQLYAARVLRDRRAALILTAATAALLHLRDGMLGWALLGGMLAYIFLQTGRLWFCMLAHFFVNTVTILLARMNETLSVSTGSRIDFAMKSGMNASLLGGFGAIAISLALILFTAARALSGRKYSAMELAILAVLASAALIVGVTLTSAGNS